MANLGYEQTSGTFQHDMAKEKLKTKKAERMKLMEEVYNLSVDNEAQAMMYREFTSPQFQTTRQLRDKAAQAEANTNIAKSMLLQDDIKIERMQKGIAALQSNPSPELYKKLRVQFAIIEPYLSEVMPETYGPEAMKVLDTINTSAIRSKEHRQQLEMIGVRGHEARRLQQQKYNREDKLQAARDKQALEMLNRKIDAEVGMLDSKNQNDIRVARLQVGKEFENMAVEMENLGDYPGATKMRLLGMQMQQKLVEVAKLKAQNAASSSALLANEQDRKSREAVENQAKAIFEKDPAFQDAAMGWNPDAKTLDAQGLPSTVSELTSMARTVRTRKHPNGVAPADQPKWVSDRMMIDPETTRFKPLPLTAEGEPAGGITSKQIASWVGQTHPMAGNVPVPSYLQDVEDMSDAVELYRWILANALNKSIIW